MQGDYTAFKHHHGHFNLFFQRGLRPIAHTDPSTALLARDYYQLLMRLTGQPQSTTGAFKADRTKFKPGFPSSKCVSSSLKQN